MQISELVQRLDLEEDMAPGERPTFIRKATKLISFAREGENAEEVFQFMIYYFPVTTKKKG